jgi:selenocysteine-specific elongation factor
VEAKRYVLIGTAGHIDHGKTSLVKMLTGCETDTLKEERERGLTIDIGFAPCELRGDLMACMVDVPGHEKFVRNMVAGATGIDAVLLVVAANDSVMPQTVEHLRIVEILGIERGLVAVTKIDMVDEELRELAILEVHDLLKGTFLENAPVCPVSSVTGEGFEALWLALTDVVESCRDRPVDGIFRMPVESAFTVQGFGTVITGMPPSGRVRVGEKLELLPQGKTGRLRGLEVYGKPAEEGFAGQCLALNVADLDTGTIERGNVLATPGYLAPFDMAEARLKLLPSTPRPLLHQAAVRFHSGTEEVQGRVFFLDRERLDAGEEAFVQFRLDRPVVVTPGDRYVIRQAGPVVTIGGGRILRPSAQKAKRFREGLVADLGKLEGALADPADFVEWLLGKAGAEPQRMEDLKGRALLPEARLREVLEHLVAEGRAVRLPEASTYVAAGALRDAEERIRKALAEYHAANPLRLGLDAHALRKAADLEPALAEAAIASLAMRKAVAREGGRVALAGHRVTLSPADEALAAKLETTLLAAGVSPPEIPALAAETSVSPQKVTTLLFSLCDRGVAVRVSEEIFAHREGESKARKLLVDHLRANGKLGVVDYRDLLGASRKYVYAWLDHFDALGVTYRVENLRYLRESAAGQDS